jgi:hypothetical protein
MLSFGKIVCHNINSTQIGYFIQMFSNVSFEEKLSRISHIFKVTSQEKISIIVQILDFFMQPKYKDVKMFSAKFHPIPTLGDLYITCENISLNNNISMIFSNEDLATYTDMQGQIITQEQIIETINKLPDQQILDPKLSISQLLEWVNKSYPKTNFIL